MHKPAIPIRPNTSDAAVYKQIFTDQEYHLPGLYWFLKKPTAIIDAGAYAGFSTCFFHQQFPKAMLWAIEPADNNFKALVLNAQQWPNTTCIQAALWPTEATLYIDKTIYPQTTRYGAETPTWHYTVSETAIEDRESVPSISIPQLMQQHQLEHISILKLDIEGSEKELFEANCDWLNQVDVLFVETHDGKKDGCSKAFYDAIQDKPFLLFFKGENTILIRKTLGTQLYILCYKIIRRIHRLF